MSSVSTAGRRPRPASPHAARVAANRARFGRIALIVVLVLLASSYVRPALDWIGARNDASAQEQRLAALRSTAAKLEREKTLLSTQRGLAYKARGLGMVHEGERAYVVRGLPKD